MRRIPFLLAVLVALATPAGLAHGWNLAGHMVTGAIAYHELKAADPAALREAVALLRRHPFYESRWLPMMRTLWLSPAERELFLFMMAARYPDDFRGAEDYLRPVYDPLHYINFPFRPDGQPESVPAPEPRPPHILSAFEAFRDTLRSTAPAPTRAKALAWLFHLVGDVHQPLHAVALFSTTFPEGDRGGTRFYVRRRTGGAPINLHGFWDDLVLDFEHPPGLSEFRLADRLARALRARPALGRAALDELSERSFDRWASVESLELARTHVYRSGRLRGASDRNRAPALPRDYVAANRPVAERRATLAGYRIADLLVETF